MNIEDLGKDTLSRQLGGFSIERLLEARKRTLKVESPRWSSPVIVESSGEAGEEELKLNEDVIEVGNRLSLEAVLAAPSFVELKLGGQMAPERSLAAPGAAAQDAATELKIRLAVRDWTDPKALLPAALDAETANLALAIVAPEARTDVRNRPGLWYYEVSPRRRILATRELEELRACVQPAGPDDRADPVRRAFELHLAEPPVEPGAEIDLEVLRAMQCAGDWLGDRCKVDRDRIAALIEKRLRQEDVDRILQSPLVGRDVERDRLRDFLLAPRTGQPLALLEIYGVGGSGKSTLLAHVEAGIRGRPDAPVLVHLDFDREYLDVDDPYSLDLALLDAIAGARPDKAAACLSLANELAGLRQGEREDRQSRLGKQGRRLGAAARKGNIGFAEQHDLEAVFLTEGSRRMSLLGGRLGPQSEIGQGLRLALVLDTLEHVLGRGASAAHALSRWLDSLADEMNADGACVILSGRDPPPSDWSLHVPSLLANLGHEIDEPPIELGELGMDDAVSLLETSGVADRPTAQAAAAALPRVPLLLRIGAEVLKEAEVADEVRAAHAGGRVDAETSRRYLMDRIVRHVADPAARDYVLPAFALPEVTEQLLRELVVPVVDEAAGRETGRGKAKRVFQALFDSTWLTTRSPDLRSFTFLPAIRALALRLIASDPAAAALVRKVRRAAMAWHERFPTPKDEAFALYHRLMLGHPARLVGDPQGTLAILARVVDDLPEASRAALMQGRRGVPSPNALVTDDEWRASLEGVGRMRGQGPALVERGEIEAALSLYRGKPTRETGVPPDFVIQAVAYSGRWDDPLVGIRAVLEEIEGQSRRVDGRWRVPGTLRSRLYWITRLALLRDPAPLSPGHEALLAGAAADIKAVQGEAALPAIIAVAEAFSGSRIGMPAWLKAKGAMGRVVRYPLVQSLVHGNPVEWRMPREAAVVAQKEYLARVLASDHVRLSIDLNDVDAVFRALDGSRLHEVNRKLRTLRDIVRLDLARLEPVEQVMLLRGKTTEFLRPLAHALSRPMSEDTRTARAIVDAHRATLDLMSIRPDVPSPEALARRTDASKEKSWLGLVDLFDLARLLPFFCRQLTETDPGSHLGRIARTFLVWDAALTRGGSSEWGHERVGERAPRDPARQTKQKDKRADPA